MSLNVGDAAPDFTLPTDEGTFTLSSQLGRSVVVYFYPKDDTPGCTREACAFRDNLPDFSQLDATVVGISRDTVEKHGKFRQKHGLNFVLASDIDGVVCEAYGVWKEKKNYGKTYMGIERSTFVVGPDGKITALWRKVKVDGHVDVVLSALKDSGAS